jgi:hypothetical protein
MSVLRLSGFVLSLLLLASLSALAAPAKTAGNSPFSGDFPVLTGQGRLQDGVALNEPEVAAISARTRLAVSPSPVAIVPLAGRNVPEAGQ